MKRNASEELDSLIRRVYAYVAFVVGSGAIADEVTRRTFEHARVYEQVLREQDEPAVWLARLARDLLGVRSAAAPPTKQPEDLQEVVQGLEPAAREAIALSYGAELSPAQIARVLDVPEPQVERILADAGRQIHTALGGLR